MEDGTAREAQAYVIRPEFEHPLSSGPWLLEELFVSGRQRFDTHYPGFETLTQDRRMRPTETTPRRKRSTGGVGGALSEERRAH
jgi:hypothetical protein